MDGDRRHGNGRLIPAGPLREPAGRRVDFTVCNGGTPGPGEVPMRLALGEAVALDDGRRRPLADFAGSPVQALAGIGHPARFFDALRAAGLAPVGHAFPDHHAFDAATLAAIPAPRLMTEKDAVKCATFANGWFYSVPVAAKLPEAFWIALLERLAEATAARAGKA